MLIAGTRVRTPLTFLVTAACALAACGDSTGIEDRDEVVGSYEVTTLIVTQAGVTFDALELGSELELMLHENGTTSGYFFVPPEEGEDGSGFNVDLEGTWDLNGNTVTLDHEADTFLRDLEFTATGEALVAQESFPGFSVQVVLSRQ